uniref:DNA-directed RNA polymerase subunit beta n=1 Tax=Hordeum vulgare subsp. vulgare TaxID=112509 RepID=F2DY47_HORVV|nr:predicted protein [Hordeum vulgare subsp. vulgare]
MLDHGLDDALADLLPVELSINEDTHIKMQFTSLEIGYPCRPLGADIVPVTPRECRESATSYSGSFKGSIEVTIEGKVNAQYVIPVKLGDLPIMVMSSKCNLRNLAPKKLAEMEEESNEVGGYFIVNGIERVIRLLQIQRRNYAVAIERSTFRNRGNNYSDKGVAMKCTKKDLTSATITLHYLNNGCATLRFVLRKQEFLLPVILVAKSLMNISDKELFDRIVGENLDNTFLTTRIELLLRDYKQYNLHSMNECLAYLGSLFRNLLGVTSKYSDLETGILLIKRNLFIHVESFGGKLDCLIFMIRKLFSFVQGKCINDNADALMNHDLLLPGHLLNMIIKEKLEESLTASKGLVIRDSRVMKGKFEAECLKNNKYFQRLCDRVCGNIGAKIATFLSSGNVVSSSGLDLMQKSGFTIIAERLNLFRFFSHFQSVHRGQFFTTMKTTTVRKLLPESWGFLCPVHTPDGAPCGLLNHLAKDAVILSYPPSKKPPITTTHPVAQPSAVNLDLLCSKSYLQEVLVSLGMQISGLGNYDGQAIFNERESLSVLIDGVFAGFVQKEKAPSVVAQLRRMKSLAKYGRRADLPYILEPTTEIGFIPKLEFDNLGPYPGIYIFTQHGRMSRPVLNLHTKEVEWIGPMEQVFMEIACVKEDIFPSPFKTASSTSVEDEGTSHIELSPTVMLSQIASLTPYSDYNQSPRNMYQCQMGKQTMGTPTHAFKFRADNKLYRILNVQAPIVQTKTHGEYFMDEYPQGCNAVVAVISYTGYDMEDAMIINKAAYERGFGHGCVYKTMFVDLEEEEVKAANLTSRPSFKFSNFKGVAMTNNQTSKISLNSPVKHDAIFGGDLVCESLDYDGLPAEGNLVHYGEPIVCLIDVSTGNHKIISHKDHEPAYIDAVRVIGLGSSTNTKVERSNFRRVAITLRYRRNPIIGDKFSSRHGQKGTLSVLWPQENMPFSESGMSPDVLINPHAFPSRMTIGMLIESMAGKAGAIHGMFQDATPFQFHEERKVIDYVGEQLRACGYQYYGSEPLYNGLTGKVMQADIFIGLVFYQRLRHMVSDKSQVRSTGPVTAITRQPVKGRKKHGGIRLGEMERDALLSHGVAFCLQDRLMNCSDSHVAFVCSQCGNLLSIFAQSIKNSIGQSTMRFENTGFRTQMQQTCHECKNSEFVRPVYLPYVFRYLTNELAGMGIKLTLEIENS